MSTYPQNGYEYNEKSNVNQNQNYPHQMNQGYVGQQNPNYQPPYNYPSSYVGVPQPQPPPPPPQPQPPYYVVQQIPQQNYGMPQQNPMQQPPQQPARNAPTYIAHPANSLSNSSKPQQNTNFVVAANMIITSGGMKFAWGSGMSTGIFYGYKSQSEHLAVSWFVGVIIGAFICALLINKVGKKVIYYIGSLLVIIGGILFTSCPINVSAILVARYMDGIASGLAIIAILCSSGELTVKEMRGMVGSMERLSFCVGFMIQSICGFYINVLDIQTTNQIHGGITIMYGVMAILFNVIFTIESPVYHLLHNNETEALFIQKKLLNATNATDQLSHAYLEEHKRLIAEDSNRSKSENILSSIMPIIQLGIVRSVVGLTISLPMNILYVYTYFLNYQMTYGMFYYALLRFLGSIIGTFLIDKVGRKSIAYISLVCSGAFVYAVGGVYEYQYLDEVYWCVPLLIIFQFFVGLGVEPTSAVYLSEAFSLSVKPFAIFAVILIENLVQIVTVVIIYSISISIPNSYTIILFSLDFSGFCYAMGSFLFCIFIMFVVVFPETKGLTLRVCLQRFSKFSRR